MIPGTLPVNSAPCGVEVTLSGCTPCAIDEDIAPRRGHRLRMRIQQLRPLPQTELQRD